MSAVDLWIIDAKIHWSTCKDNWATTKIAGHEWQKLEYQFLEIFVEVPDDLVAYLCTEYNVLVKHAREFNLDIVPIPSSQMRVHPSMALVASVQSRQVTACLSSGAPTPMAIPISLSCSASLFHAVNPSAKALPLQEPSLPAAQLVARQHKVQPCPVAKASAANTTFQIDQLSPLHKKSGIILTLAPLKKKVLSEAPPQSSPYCLLALPLVLQCYLALMMNLYFHDNGKPKLKE
ncbi:hypothetical protein IW261DRAFT_1566003 [Armillaria novae-zelandiae]|uniref:Uncharacterized protein n=1 Tax=Armillaria novae-zelandiae TaxID=153914 RepID=A0AA39P4Z3_9AGAR|nr:hypothetical protein IW261DRAFT_1566003 [Armillaria novae-zelandiae]